MDLLLATRNAHKTREFAELLGPHFQIRDLRSLSHVPDVIESGSTFEENVAIKALAVSRLFPEEVVIADDSGLEVEALGGAPGVFSARYAGENATDEENMAQLLAHLRKANAMSLPSAARFRCAIAVARQGQCLAAVTGEVYGHIAPSPRGTNGFGYDPLFVPQGLDKTFAELSGEVKNRLGHRARAAKKLRAFLEKMAG